MCPLSSFTIVLFWVIQFRPMRANCGWPSILAAIACSFIAFNSYTFFSAQPKRSVVRRRSLLRIHRAPTAAPSRASPQLLASGHGTAAATVQTGGSTGLVDIQCTNMAGPWFRKDQSRYRPYRAVPLEAPFRARPDPIQPQLNFFPLETLRLGAGTRYAAAAAANLQYLLDMPTDSLLWAWRALAKRPQPAGAKPFRSGWEHPGSELRGHFLVRWPRRSPAVDAGSVPLAQPDPRAAQTHAALSSGSLFTDRPFLFLAHLALPTARFVFGAPPCPHRPFCFLVPLACPPPVLLLAFVGALVVCSRLCMGRRRRRGSPGQDGGRGPDVGRVRRGARRVPFRFPAFTPRPV